MSEMETYLLTMPQSSLLLYLAGLMFFTTLGLLPNNTDLTVLTAGMMSGFGHFVLWQALVVCIFSYFSGEGLMFWLGRILGSKAENWRIHKKIMGQGRKEKMVALINEKPFSFFLSVRLTPVLRPFVIMSLGTIGIAPKTYGKYHLPITFFYTLLLGTVSFAFSQAVRNQLGQYKFHMLIGVIITWLVLIKVVMRKNKKAPLTTLALGDF